MRCPRCQTPAVKRGVRKTKAGVTQLYFCKECRRRFSLSPLPAYSYPPAVVLAAPVYYYQGLTLREIRDRLGARFKHRPSEAMISHWVKKFGNHSPLKHQREQIRDFAAQQRVIRRRLFRHRQNYLFQVNQYKLSLVSSANGLALKRYLDALADDTIRIRSEQFGSRVSVAGPEVNVNPPARPSYACKIAGIALKAARNNRQRHAMVQKFLLATDGATMAVEVPVFLTTDETQKIIGQTDGVLGHIDFVQVFGEMIRVLDYKPEAEKEKNAAAQLFLYALALSRRTGIHLKYIHCAWFDEKGLYAFPSMDAYKLVKTDAIKGPGTYRPGAASEKVAALNAQEYFEERAKHASRAKFEKALARVPDAKLEPDDAL